MHEIIIISNLFGLPHKRNIFQLVNLDTLSRDSFRQDRVGLVSEVFVIESEIIRLVSNDFETNLNE